MTLDAHIKARAILDRNNDILREVIASAQAVAADLSGNADSRRRGDLICVEAARIERLVAAVEALDMISLPTGS